MGFIANLSIKAKLILSFLLVVFFSFLVLLISVSSEIGIIKSVKLSDSILTGNYIRITNIEKTVSEVDNNIIKWLNPSHDHSFTSDDYTNYKKSAEDAISYVNALNEYFISDAEFTKNILLSRQKVRAYVDYIKNTIEPLVAQGDYDKAVITYLDEGRSKFLETRETLTKVISAAFSEIERTNKEASSTTGVYISIFLGIVSFIVSMGLALYIASYISNYLKALIRALDKMADGDFSFQLTYSQHKGEFGYSSRAIKRMIDSLNSVLSLVIKESSRINSELTTIQEFSNKITKQITHAQSQSSTVASAAEELVSNTNNIAQNCEGAAANSEESRNITVKGVSAVNNTVNIVNRQSELTKENALKVESLAKQTTEIGSIVSTIDEIAAQTNLLALNAAIEAARAGEAGRGFAVVADEVRALASRTSQSTQEISNMVSNIQNEAKSASIAIASSVESMDDVAKDSEGIASILQEISDHVTQVNTQINQIAEAAENQTNSTTEISNNMEGITQATEQIVKSSSEAYDSISRIKVSLDDLCDKLSFFKLSQN